MNENYITQIRTEPGDFTRNRKVIVEDIFLQMLSNKGMSQKSEIYNFYEDVNKQVDVSQTAFYNARMKFNPEALLTIMKDLISDEYSEPDALITLNDYYVMAVDGSDFVLPNTDENREHYGVAQTANKYGDKYAMSSISTYFDCINKLFLDVSINKYKYSELKSASKHLIDVQKMIPAEAKYLTIFDRGYLSIRLILQMLESNQKFLIRLSKDKFLKEQKQLTDELNDQWIDVEYDRARSNHYRNDREFRARLMNSKIRLRFVRLPFRTREGDLTYSTFVTNLSEEDFDTNGLYELYHLRWDIETSYRSLKSQLKVEEFSGYRDALIRQDIYAGAFVYNAVSMTISENTSVQEVPSNRYKYEMKTNRNFALGVLKKDLLKMFVLYKNKKAMSQAQERFEKNIIKYSCPVRKERKQEYKRIRKGVNKSKLSYRRSF